MASDPTIEELKAEAMALRESEATFRTVFETMIEACCIFEMIYDHLGRPVDWMILEANAAYEKQSGLKDVAGKLASEFMPGTEAYWIETFSRVVETGVAEQIERWHQPTGRWVHSSTARIGGSQSKRLASVFYDITERKHAEIALRESEERQTFLLNFSDMLRGQPDEGGIATAAVELVAAQMKVDRCWIAILIPDEGRSIIPSDCRRSDLSSLQGDYRYSDFPETARQLETGILLIDDIQSSASLTDDDKVSFAGLKIGSQLSVCLKKGGGRVKWSLTVADEAPRRWTREEAALLEETAERTWTALERVRAEAAQRESEERFQQFARASSAGIWIRNAETLTMEYVSPVIEKIYGVSENAFLGDIQRWAAMIVPEDRDAALAHIEQARQGEPAVHEFRVQRPSDQAFRWIRNTDFPLFDSQGRVERIGGIAEDVTDEKLSVEHQAVLLAELQHRVRNIMAILRSIAARTGESAGSVKEYAELIAGRLTTFARVQALLTRAANAGVGIATIVNDELAALAAHAGQFDADGPDVELSPKAAETMTLAVHELTTNALKYGALSVSEGKVTVRWEIVEKQGRQWLSFDWSERGAPPQPQTDKPRRVGFGSELIEGRIPYELSGRGKVWIGDGGAQCHLEFPLREGASILETGAPHRAIVFGGAIDMSGQADLTGHRVLVVEDDYYLAADTARALRGAGADVIGPAATEADARAELARTAPTCAVLDINLRGGRSFELAGDFKRDGVPFLFITGYDQDVIPERFEGTIRLQKPVEFRHIIEALADTLGVER